MMRKPTRWFVVVFAICTLCYSGEVSKFDNGIGDWKFTNGGEFKGAKGSAEITKQGREGGAVELKADFSGGGRYVALYKVFEQPVDAQKLSMWIKSHNLKSFMLRLTDETGQTHQSSHILKESADWQGVSLTQEGFASKTHWGGDNDGVWHGKIKKIYFMIEKSNIKDGDSAWLRLDEVTLE